MKREITNQQLVKLTLSFKELLREKGIYTSISYGDIYRCLRGEMIGLGIRLEDEPEIPNEPIKEISVNDL